MIKLDLIKKMEQNKPKTTGETENKVVIAQKIKRVREILNKNGEVIRTIEF